MDQIDALKIICIKIKLWKKKPLETTTQKMQIWNTMNMIPQLLDITLDGWCAIKIY